jgi:hypothetical protein
MININKGLKEFNSDSHLITALVEGWIEASIKYLRKAPEDLPYLYNERADVSLLCAGAWMKGFVAIEEYISLKDDKLGRPDIFIKMKAIITLTQQPEQLQLARERGDLL